MADFKPLATGAFSSGPQDEMAVGDVYKLIPTPGVGTITSIQDLNLGIGTSVFNILGSGKEIDKLLNATTKGIAFDVGSFTDRVLGTSSSFNAAYSELSSSVKNGAALETLKTKADDVMCTVNNVKSMVSASDMKTMKSIGSFINQYTGSSIFSTKDNTALGNLLGSVVGQASSLGIGGAFSAVTSTINDNGLLGKIVRSVLPLAIANSDLPLLRDITSSPAGKLINIFSPGFSQTLASSFRYPQGRSRGNYQSYDDLITSFSNVNSQWDAFNQNGEEGSSILGLLGGSRDFQNLLLYGVTRGESAWNEHTRRQNHSLASRYRETTVKAELNRHFPKVPILSLENTQAVTKTKTNVQDPRMFSNIANILLA